MESVAAQGLRSLLGTFLALLISLAVLLTGTGLLGSLTALRMQYEGVESDLIGAVMACYSAGFIISSLYFGRIIYRVGHIRAFAVLAALAAGSTLIYPLFIDPVTWGLMRAVLGFSAAGLFMVVESWLNGRTPREARGTVLAFYSIATWGALGGGQMLLNAWPVSGFELFNLAALLFAISLLPVTLTRAPSPELVEGRPVSVARLYRIAPLGFVGAGMAGLMSGSFVALGPVFGRAIGLGVSEVAVLMAAGMLGGLLLQWPVGWLSDRISRRLAIVGVASLATAAAAVITLLDGDSPRLLAVMTMIWGGLAFTLYPLCLALSNDFVTSEEIVGTGAGLLLVNGVGMMIGPVVIGRLMAVAGGAALFASLAAAGLALTLFALWRLRAGETIPVAAQSHFHAVPVDVTPQTAGLDPQVDDPQLELDFSAGEEEADVVNSSPSEPGVPDS